MKEPKIVELKEKKLVGVKVLTSIEENKTSSLWKSFIPKTKKITSNENPVFFSIQMFEEDFSLSTFTAKTKFTKIAAIEKSENQDIPDGLEQFELKGGLYAVFKHKGAANTFHLTSQYIFRNWLPTSNFDLDNRPHFEVMGKNYIGPNNSSSEEEVWVPIKKRFIKNAEI